MAQEQQNPAEWIASNMKDALGANADHIRETNKAGLDVSRALMAIIRETATVLRERGDHELRTRMAVMEAAFDANFEQLNRIAESRNLQDVVRLQVLWGANQTLAVCHALTRANRAEHRAGEKPGKHAAA